MKGFLFTSLLCMMASGYASETNQATLPIRLVCQNEQTPAMVQAAAEPYDTPVSVLDSMLRKKLLDEKSFHKMAQAVSMMRLDSIVGGLSKGTVKYTLQKFEYDENGWPVKRTNAYWDSASETWEPSEWYEYVCDEDGYCITQMAYSEYSGQRYDFEYNDKKLGIVQILSLYDGEVWTPTQRGEYEYDDRDNIIQETISAWDSSAESWVPVIRNKAQWDDLGRQIDFEPYSWTGSEWTGNPDGEKKIHVFDDMGNVTLIGSYIWDKDLDDWFYYCRYEQDFNSFGKCTRQEKMFYNKELDNWDGYEYYFGVLQKNTLSRNTYDDYGRDLYGVGYVNTAPGEYVKGADIVYNWTDIEGGTQCVETSTLYFEDEDPYVNDITIRQYDENGNQTLLESQHVSNRVLTNYEKNIFKFDTNGNLLEDTKWKGDGADGWIPSSSSEFTYNEDNLIVEQISKRGDGDEWVNYNRFTWAYENGDVLVEKLAYRWTGDDWAPNWGNGDFYDFTTPVSSLIVWPGANFDYKLLETRSYSGMGNDWDYMSFVYYYSDFINTGISETRNDYGLRIDYRNNTVVIKSENDIEARIYNAMGECVAVSTEHNIDVTELPYGVYVVKAGTSTLKFIKK